jgi:orotate phosphoribosyltransferase-like protein
MTTSLKEKILELRNEGKNYNEISETLGCSKSTISFHCNNNNLGGNFVSKQRVKLTKSEIEEFLDDRKAVGPSEIVIKI